MPDANEEIQPNLKIPIHHKSTNDRHSRGGGNPSFSMTQMDPRLLGDDGFFQKLVLSDGF